MSEYFRFLFRGGLDTFAISKHTGEPEAKVLKAITLQRRPDTDFATPPIPYDHHVNSPAFLEARKTGLWKSRMCK
jgi:hypothetical protein